MKTVAIVSLKGGVGKTTVAANLGAALARRHPDVLLVDFDPRNQLGLHVGLAAEAVGLAQAGLRGVGWGRALHYGADGVACLPFGAVGEDEVGAFEAQLGRQPELLREALADPALHAYSLAIVDGAAGPSPYFDAAVRLADLLLVVLLADAASFATLPALYAILRRRRHGRGSGVGAWALLNSIDGTRLGRDVRAVIAAQPELPLAPLALHRDEAVREALAYQLPVIARAPSSQAAEDFRRAADWLTATLAGATSGAREPPLPMGGRTVAEVPPANGAGR